jgi:hypothetical protein
VLFAPPPARAVKACTCDELRSYLKTVEKKEDCYKKIYEAGRTKPLTTGKETNAAVETCMGWTPGSAVSEGKPSTADPQAQQQAEDECKAAHCDWICNVSINEVHEKYHEWYDANERMYAVTLLLRAVVGSGKGAMQQENDLGEIGAHDAEAQLLRDRIQDAEKNGQCSNVQGTVYPAERERRIKEAADRVKKYLDSLGGSQ